MNLYPTETELRLECLRLATQAVEDHGGGAKTVAVARLFYDFANDTDRADPDANVAEAPEDEGPTPDDWAMVREIAREEADEAIQRFCGRMCAGLWPSRYPASPETDSEDGPEPSTEPHPGGLDG